MKAGEGVAVLASPEDSIAAAAATSFFLAMARAMSAARPTGALAPKDAVTGETDDAVTVAGEDVEDGAVVVSPGLGLAVGVPPVDVVADDWLPLASSAALAAACFSRRRSRSCSKYWPRPRPAMLKADNVEARQLDRGPRPRCEPETEITKRK